MNSSRKKSVYTREEALHLMQKYCSYRERSHLEVERKMEEWGWIPEIREYVYLRLLEDDFINEERYARAVVRGKFGIKKWGRRKIVQRLKQNGVSEENIRLALQEIDEEEYERVLYELARKKVPAVKASGAYERRRKVFAYLYSKGYETEAINPVLDRLCQ